jgi:hypothetical protein
MKLGVLSDSHNNLKNLERAGEILVKEYGVEILIHLGDDYEDAKILEKFKVKLIKVPGVYSSFYQNPEIPNRRIEEFEGVKILISHMENSHQNDLPTDLTPEEIIEKKLVDLVLVGHTHIPKIEEREGVFILNPGHLQEEDKKGFPPSFGLVDLKKKLVQIIQLSDKKIFKEKKF